MTSTLPASHLPSLNEHKLSALETAIGSEQLHNLLEMLAQEARTRPTIVMKLLEMGSLLAASLEAHALKGAAFGMCADRLGEAARAVEEITSADQGPDLARLLVDAADATLLALDKRRKRKGFA